MLNLNLLNNPILYSYYPKLIQNLKKPLHTTTIITFLRYDLVCFLRTLICNRDVYTNNMLRFVSCLKIMEKVSHITLKYADELFSNSFIYNCISVN